MRDEIITCKHAIAAKIKGKDAQIELALVCMLAKGHLLIEDLPGMGKTTLSQCLANSIDLSYSRIQFTSDLLPADMLGVNIYETNSQSFKFHAGPIFSQLVLADEINRASPKTQSALLEAMAEAQVTVDGTRHQLPSPFFVIATQNPLYQTGTNPLPESQIDRFMMKISMGYPDIDAEREMLLNKDESESINAAITPEILTSLQSQVSDVVVSEKVIDYILKLVHFTRDSNEFSHPLSPRASKAIFSASQAHAFMLGRNFVIPDDVQRILPAVSEHRLQGVDNQNKPFGQLSSLLLSKVDPLAA